MSERIQKLDSILREVLREGPLSAGLREQEVLGRWSRIVGEKIARHSAPLALRDGVLLVQVESSVWAQELTLLKPRIQRALEAELGPDRVKEIRFRSGRIEARETSREPNSG